MKKIMLLGITGVVIFAASASASWFVFNQTKAPEDTESTAQANSDSAPEPTAIKPETMNSSDDSQFQVAFKPEDVSVESLLRIVDSIKGREQALDSKQLLLNKREQRVNLALVDLEREQQEIENLNSGFDTRLERLQELVQQLEQMENPEPSIDGEQTPGTPSGESANYDPKYLKKLAEWLQGMPVESAAGSIKEFVNDGKIDLVSKIMVQIEDKNAAKLLAALQDEKLITEIAQAVLKAKSGN